MQVVTKLNPKLDVASRRLFAFGDIELWNPTHLRVFAFEFFARKYTVDSNVTINRIPSTYGPS